MKIILILLMTCATAFANTEEILALMAKAPKTSKALIQRGKETIEVDLASKPKVQDYDVILLEDGVYSTLGDFSAKYVRVIGNGQRRTFISSLIKGSSPILVNSTEFWDVTIADAQFKIVDQSGMWAINVEFAGAILVRPAALDKTPGFAIRAAFSEIPSEDNLNTSLKVEPNPEALLSFEDKLDKTEDMNLKDRAALKGLVARAANYLYQTKKLKPKYDQAKYDQLKKQAQSAKAKGHLYVSLLAWAEADRLSGHSRFDEVLKEISPLSQNLSQECGCTVEGQGLAAIVKSEIEQKLYARVPISSLPGRCEIQTLHVNAKPGSTKEALISAARLQAQLDHSTALRNQEERFERTIVAHSSGSKDHTEEIFEVSAPPLVAASQYTVVADVNMPGVKKTYTSDVVKGKNDDSGFLSQNIIDPIAKAFNDRFAAKIKAATAKINSKDLIAKVDGLIEYALYGADPSRQNNYEELHEQQFGRKVSSEGAASSVFAY